MKRPCALLLQGRTRKSSETTAMKAHLCEDQDIALGGGPRQCGLRQLPPRLLRGALLLAAGRSMIGETADSGVSSVSLVCLSKASRTVSNFLAFATVPRAVSPATAAQRRRYFHARRRHDR